MRRKRKDKCTVIRDYLDALVQTVLKKLYKECLVCSNPCEVMHHYIQKSQSTYLRWDVRNLVPLCTHCHTLHHKNGDPRIHQVIVKRKGHAWADELERDRRIIVKRTVANYERIKDEWDSGRAYEHLAARKHRRQK